jgi:hypothetical protein
MKPEYPKYYYIGMFYIASNIGTALYWFREGVTIHACSACKNCISLMHKCHGRDYCDVLEESFKSKVIVDPWIGYSPSRPEFLSIGDLATTIKLAERGVDIFKLGLSKVYSDNLLISPNYIMARYWIGQTHKNTLYRDEQLSNLNARYKYARFTYWNSKKLPYQLIQLKEFYEGVNLLIKNTETALDKFKQGSFLGCNACSRAIDLLQALNLKSNLTRLHSKTLYHQNNLGGNDS